MESLPLPTPRTTLEAESTTVNRAKPPTTVRDILYHPRNITDHRQPRQTAYNSQGYIAPLTIRTDHRSLRQTAYNSQGYIAPLTLRIYVYVTNTGTQIMDLTQNQG